jgi:hypothetical protein
MERLMMRRRSALAGLGSLVAPAVARGQSGRVLKFVPRTGLALLDPVWTTETATRAFALSVFESLLQCGREAGAASTDGGRPYGRGRWKALGYSLARRPALS